MRRALVAAALVAALSAAIVAQAARSARPAPVLTHSARAGPRLMPDAAAIVSLRAVARSGAGQARTLGGGAPPPPPPAWGRGAAGPPPRGGGREAARGGLVRQRPAASSHSRI